MAAVDQRLERKLQRLLADARRLERQCGLEPTPRFVPARGMTAEERFDARVGLVLAACERVKAAA